MSNIRGPTQQQRTIILGRTGTGKSQFAMHLLSSREFDKYPWYIIDYKGGDDIIRALVTKHKKLIKNISPNKDPPTKPGLYYMTPTPKIDDDAMEAWLFKVWGNGKKGFGSGLFVDEGYQLPQRDGFDIILTQGRALNISVICLYQRPTWMSRFAVAQADFFAIFAQNDERDLKTTKSFIDKAILPDGTIVDVYTKLDRFYCLWYDVSRGQTSILKPAPSRQKILATFSRRLEAEKQKGSFV